MNLTVKLCFMKCKSCKVNGALLGSVDWCVMMGCRCIYLPAA